MLLKKLLPISAILVAATATTPLFVSCGKSEIGSWTSGKSYKPLKPKKAKTIIGNDDDLTKEYEKDVKEMKNIYSDDFVNFISRGGYTRIDEAMDFDVKSIQHQTIDVGQGSTEMGGGIYAFPISFTMTFSADATINATSKLKYQDSIITFTNFPVKFIYFETQGILGKENDIVQCETVSKESIISNKDWTIDMPELVYDQDSDTFTLGENKIYSVEKSLVELISKPKLLEAFTSFLRFFTMFESNYYYNVEVKQQ